MPAEAPDPAASQRHRARRRTASVVALLTITAAAVTAGAVLTLDADRPATADAAGPTATASDQDRADRLAMLARPPSRQDPRAVAPPPGTGKRIVVDESEQRTWLWEGRTLVRTYLVSGKVGYPGPGDYRIYSKSPRSWLAETGQTFEYMVRFAHGRYLPLGFHSIPLERDGTPSQSAAQLGQPLSHGCVRQLLDDARFLYEWAPVGTPVTVRT